MKARHLVRSLTSAAVFHLRRRSLLRANLLVLGSVAMSFPLAGFPNDRRDPALIVPALLALFGTLETVRCVRPRWDLYHAGLILLLWMDMMAVCLVFFFLFSPYVF
ncbi:MAG TPA: hypothetical protein VN612_03170 [Acidobacteriaceae bacterium]|nr:hypothetical protein [Acidobacteriaceae bacterium]